MWLWRKEILLFLILTGFASVLSYFMGYFLPILLLIVIVLLIRQIFFISRLETWLRAGSVGKIPDNYDGVWGDIYDHFAKIRLDKKKRKKKLSKIIDQFRRSTDVLPDAAIVLNEQGEIKWTNKLAKQMLGIQKKDKGQKIQTLIQSPTFIDFLENHQNILSPIISSPIDPHHALQFKVVDYGNRQKLLMAYDVTQQKKLEAMRTDFVANVSHELRTPLTVLKGYLEILEETEPPEQVLLKKYLANMSAQTQRMQSLIDDLLMLAKLETTQKEMRYVNAAELIQRVCLESESEIENVKVRRIRLNLATFSAIYGEEGELRSAFSNLIMNALKYSADNCSVRVTWRMTRTHLIFEVIDEGEGISRENISRITERFYRVDVKRNRRLSGTGLGLSIVKHVLKHHNARLEIISTLKKGSCFRCFFPISQARQNKIIKT